MEDVDLGTGLEVSLIMTIPDRSFRATCIARSGEALPTALFKP